MKSGDHTQHRESQPPVILEITNVELRYGTKRIIRNVNLRARHGVCLGILGPNGSGKTTLLRGILGVLKPWTGSIRWTDRNGAPLRIGYVPQKERLDASFPLTIREVVQMGTSGEATWSPFLKPRQKRRIVDALRRVHMLDQKDKLFAECSGGQRQRVLIARALAAAPDVLILDEPTTGIDPSAQREVTKLLAKLKAEHTITLLIVTQHFGHLEGLFEEVAWVQGGRVHVGSAKELLTDEYLARAFGKA